MDRSLLTLLPDSITNSLLTASARNASLPFCTDQALLKKQNYACSYRQPTLFSTTLVNMLVLTL